MFLLVRADGSIQALPGVAEIRNVDNELLCFDYAGAIVERYSAQEVLLYGDEDRITPLIAETNGDRPVVQKISVDGSEETCCAVSCSDTASVVFRFDSKQGGMKVGLCGAHEGLIDDQAKKIVLSKLDLRRVILSEGEAGTPAPLYSLPRFQLDSL
jgi:hypothetical protein